MFVIAVDSREKRPYVLQCRVEVKKLVVGDYSPLGYEDFIAVERKSFEDLYRCLTVDIERFKDQLERLGKLLLKTLIVDTSPAAILMGSPHSRVPGYVVFSKLTGLSIKYGIPVIYAGNQGATICQVWLAHAVKCLRDLLCQKQ